MPKPRLLTSRRGLAAVAAAVLTVGMAGGALSPAAAATTVPSVPLSLTASQTAAGEVTLGWRAPASTGGSPITRYDAYWSTGQAGSGMPVAASARTAVFTGLDKGSYTFSVVAVNAKGSSQPANVPVTVTTSAPPAPTPTVSATSLVAGSALTISGHGTPGSAIYLERALPGHGYVPLRTLTVDGAGDYTDTRTVKYTAYYRVSPEAGPPSAARRVVVQNLMQISAVRTAPLTYTLNGSVYPARDGQHVRLAWLQNDGTYALLADVHTGPRGNWTYPRAYRNVRTMTFRATSAATPYNAPRSIRLAVNVY